ncbi:glycosyltransferase BC10-like [Arachis duranensis]|uniref:Glycosyltransferase BC10-like n=1 Tax=Arachis duranensis TaxID=130453 RepID=A0A6P4BYE5_ARADU|nr:glycosyltransferase BC10-like [Arachis duranensis]
MLSPNSFSLLFAILLCLPLAIVFTTTTTTTTITTSTTTITITKNTTITTAKLFHDPNPPIPNLTTTFYIKHPNNTSRQPPPPPPPPPPSEAVAEYNDDEEEKELFRMASRAKRKPTNTKKLAFMFLTTTPLPFAPLWESFFNKSPRNLYNIYVHADPTFSYDPPFSGVFRNRTIPSKPTARYTPTLAAAARRLLARALIHDRNNHMFLLLSPSCIPLHSFNFTYSTLAHSRKSFIEILTNETGSYDRWAARGDHVMLPEVTLDDFRIGSQFWALTRKHARLVVSETRLWSKFKLPCVRWDTCYPEENYFPTLLAMWDSRGCVHATLTHVDWSGSEDGHPRMYQKENVGPELFWALRKGRPRYGDGGREIRRRRDPFLFARKFAPDSLQALMQIADDFIFRD